MHLANSRRPCCQTLVYLKPPNLRNNKPFFPQVEHGKLVPAMTHAAMALSCVHGLSLVRPQEQSQDHEHDQEPHSNKDRGGRRSGVRGGSGTGEHSSHGGLKGGKHDAAAKPLHPPPIAPGVVAWRGAHWELANAAAVGPGAARAMVMVAGACAAMSGKGFHGYAGYTWFEVLNLGTPWYSRSPGTDGLHNVEGRQCPVLSCS